MLKPEKLYKGEFSNVYVFMNHLIEIADPSGWKPSWKATNRLTGKITCKSVSKTAVCSDLSRILNKGE